MKALPDHAVERMVQLAEFLEGIRMCRSHYGDEKERRDLLAATRELKVIAGGAVKVEEKA